jgi:hypothetical protein
MSEQCKTEGCTAELRFISHYGAPGIGSHWQCTEGHDWSRVGTAFYPPESGAHILTLEQCR